MPADLQAERAALRARQGLGARYDSPGAPARELDWARRGSAYFARKLNELSDEDLSGPSLVRGWKRRHVVACVGYHARALTRLTTSARTARVIPMYESERQRDEEIAEGTTLPPAALRYLFQHAEVHLNVEWRDLTDVHWDMRLDGGRGAPGTARATVWQRATEVWLRAIDLNNGGGFWDFAPDFLDTLINARLSALDAPHSAFTKRLRRSDVDEITLDGQAISGRPQDIARYLFGYGVSNLRVRGDVPPIPRVS